MSTIRMIKWGASPMLFVAAAIAAVICSTSARAANPPTTYKVVNLGSLLGPNISGGWACAINNSGQVVGCSPASPYSHAFSWTQTGGMIDLHTILGARDSQATAVNNNGQVAGWLWDTGTTSSFFVWTSATGMVNLGNGSGGLFGVGPFLNDSGQVAGTQHGHALFWTQATGMTDLLTLGGPNSFVAGLNQGGQVVGNSYPPAPGGWHAFSWTQVGGMIDLGVLGGPSNPTAWDTYSQAFGVNNNGQVVGLSTTSPIGYEHAFSWTAAGGRVDLGVPSGYLQSRAFAVNDGGWIVGAAMNGAYSEVVVLWTPGGNMIEIGVLPGGSWSRATAVNANGQVIGVGDAADGYQHGFSWTDTGGMVDLPLLPGMTQSSVNAINDAGQIVGNEWGDAGQAAAVLWQPVTAQADVLTIDEAKIDWKDKPDDDKIMAKGSFTLPSGSVVNPGDPVYFAIGLFDQTITAYNVKGNGKKWEFHRAKGDTGIKDMKLEFKKNAIDFEIHVDKANLPAMGSWGNPKQLYVSLWIGDDQGSKCISMNVKKDKWEYHK